MLGIMGIMALGPLAIFAIGFIIAAAVSGGTAAYINHKQSEDAEKNMNKMQAAQAAANAKAEQRAKVQARIQNAVNAKQLNKTVLEAASSVTYQKILADRTRSEAAKKRVDGNLVPSSVAVTSMPEKYISGSNVNSVSGVSESYNMGSPKKSAV